MSGPPRPARSSAHSVPPPFRRVPQPAGPAGPPPGPSRPRAGNPSLHVLCGAIAVAAGAVVMVSKLFMVGGWDVHGNHAFELGKDAALVIAPALVVAGAFHLRRGIRRYKGVEVPEITKQDRLRNIGISVALLLLVLLAAPIIPDPDNRFDDGRAPYSYKFPSDWNQGDARAILRTFPWMREVSQIGRGDNNAGVSVSTTWPGDAASGVDQFAAVLRAQGGAIVVRRNVTVAGLPGLTVEYDMPAARHDGSMTVLNGTDRRFLVWCQWESDPASAKEGCAKVHDTLRIK